MCSAKRQSEVIGFWEALPELPRSHLCVGTSTKMTTDPARLLSEGVSIGRTNVERCTKRDATSYPSNR